MVCYRSTQFLAMNKTIFQFFHWYYSAEGNLWNHCRDEAATLASLGVTDVWLPPAYKSAKGTEEPGYAVYDLYDLGEFDQKGTIRTRYGTRDEYLACIASLHDKQLSVIADIVLNHKHGADETEKIPVVKVKEEDRQEITSGLEIVDAYTRFTFPGRKGRYSDFIWDWHTFTGICQRNCIELIQHEYSVHGWDDLIDGENGNYDYLMCNDIEFRNPYVKEELKRWGQWYVQTTDIDGFRLDALKHINPAFFPEWLDHMESHFNKKFFCIGEYWKNDVNVLLKYLDATGGKIQLFDVPLHYNFNQASVQSENYDMRTIFDDTLIKNCPERAISFVDNHDTQPLQALQSPVEQWFKPHAYALILLRQEGIPCVFYPALYDAKYVDITPEGEEVYVELNRIELVGKMMKVRSVIAYGNQRDYFDDPHVVGWTRQGIEKTGCAVLMSNAGEGIKTMSLGHENAGRTLKDISGNINEPITLNESGEATFMVKERSVSVWIDATHEIIQTLML